jgi:hypothetical protein
MPDDNFRARRPQHDPNLIRKFAEDVLGVPKQSAPAQIAPPVTEPVAPKLASVTVPKSQPRVDEGEFVQFATRIPKTLQRQMRMYSVEHDISIQALTIQVFSHFFEKAR